MTETILAAVLGSGALSALIAGIFNIIANRKGRIGKIEGALSRIEQQLRTNEKDVIRTQLLLLISDYPDQTTEILTLAEHYFKDLRGDWYMTSLFNRWLTAKGAARPEWFDAAR